MSCEVFGLLALHLDGMNTIKHSRARQNKFSHHKIHKNMKPEQKNENINKNAINKNETR